MLEKGGFEVVWFLSHVMVQSPNILVIVTYCYL